MIAWLYLNKRDATIEAIKDCSSMEFIINNYENIVDDTRAKMESLPSTMPSGMPKSKSNPKAFEARMAKGIDEIDVLKERYRQALEYMEWFRPAWDALSSDDKYVLTEYFLNDAYKTNAIQNICDQLCIERSGAYKRKDVALMRLTLLLYGK